MQKEPLSLTLTRLILVTSIIVSIGALLGVLGYFMAKKPAEVEMPKTETLKEVIKDETADWQTYRNEEYGFEVKYPSDWQKADLEHYNINDVMRFDSPQGQKASPASPQNNVATISIRIMKNKNMEEEMNTEKLGAKIIDKNAVVKESEITVAGIKVKQIESSYVLADSSKTLVINTFLSHNGNLYRIGFGILPIIDQNIAQESENIYDLFLFTFKFTKK